MFISWNVNQVELNKNTRYFILIPLWSFNSILFRDLVYWCLMAPSHYLNQCWLIIKDVMWHSSESIFRSAFELNLNICLENILLKLQPHLRWVKMWALLYRIIAIYQYSVVWLQQSIISKMFTIKYIVCSNPYMYPTFLCHAVCRAESRLEPSQWET